MAFAGTVMLGDLDDFIAPSQACTNPLFAVPAVAGSAPGALMIDTVDNSVALHRPSGRLRGARTPAAASIGTDVSIAGSVPAPISVAAGSSAPARPNLIKTTAANVAKVSLNDCLACSGCVTSAETVLITQQSFSEVLTALTNPAYSLRVASVAPQVLASLAAHYDLPSMVAAYEHLTTLLRSLGFDAVVDTAVCTQLALLETCHEFAARVENHAARTGSKPVGAAWEAPPASIAVSSTHQQLVAATTAAGTAIATGEAVLAGEIRLLDSDRVPLLASSCPGWVCYAEKTTPEAIPYISAVKSPQQLTGAAVKALLSSSRGVAWLTGRSDAAALCPPSAVYHVSIMACYDRKLEASRRDFYWETAASKEVDCVLTSTEVVAHLMQHGKTLTDFAATPRVGMQTNEAHLVAALHARAESSFAAGAPLRHVALESLSCLLCGVDPDTRTLVGCSDTHVSSDGYTEALWRYMRECVPAFAGEGEVVYTMGRNSDFQEATLVGRDGTSVTLAIAYGFRHIQSIITKLKKGKCGYQFVEIMACPGGCVNGGGQAKAPEPAAAVEGNPLLAAEAATKRQLAAADAALKQRRVTRPWCHAAVIALQSALSSFTAVTDAVSAQELLLTRYHHIPKMETSVIKW